MKEINKMVKQIIKSSNIRKVRVEGYDNEEIELKEIGDELVICVPQIKFNSMLILAEEINHKLDERYRKNKDNELSIENSEYIDVDEEYIEPENKKRNIKGPKLFNKGKRFVAGLILAGTITTGVVANIQINDYKEEQASRILSVVKEELDADHIYDRSSATGSNTSVINIVAEKDGKEYKYLAYTQDGEIIRVDRNELSQEAVNAIQIAANAQDGNIFDAMKADKYADKIESGEIELEEIGQDISKDRDDER